MLYNVFQIRNSIHYRSYEISYQYQVELFSILNIGKIENSEFCFSLIEFQHIHY